jgi:excisionase family DNA binding protein
MSTPLEDLAPRQIEGPRSARITVPEIAHELGIGRLAVYGMLEQGIIPGIRLGRRWIVTRHAYDLSSGCAPAACDPAPDLCRKPEVTVLT